MTISKAIPRLMLWGGVLILSAFMVSVTVYKLWYVATAGVVLVGALLARPSDRSIRFAAVDLAPIGIYCAAMALSVTLSDTPEVGSYFLTADTIFPVLTVLFYVVGLTSEPAEIVRAFRFLVPLAALASAITWGSVLGREGYRVAFVLPYIVPFLFIAGTSYLYAVSALAIVFVTRSRTPIVVGFALSCVAPLAMGLLKKSSYIPKIVGGATALLAAALLIPATRVIVVTVAARFAGHPISFAGVTAIPQSHDPFREKLGILFGELSSPSWFGIGYGNSGVYYAERFPDDQLSTMSLHSVYEALWVESGVVGSTSAVMMLAYFSLRVFQGYRSARSSVDQHNFLALALSAAAILFAALFHQMHQTPMLFVIMGLGLGSSRRITGLEPQRIRSETGGLTAVVPDAV